MPLPVNHAKAAWATSVVLSDAVFPSCKQQLAGSKGTSVQISGARSELLIGRKTFRVLKTSLSEVRCRHLSEGGCAVEMDLQGSVSINDSDAGTLTITFPDAKSLSAEAARNVKQFICDAELTLNNKTGKSWRVMPGTIQTDTVPWLAEVSFSRKQAGMVYAHPEAVLEHEVMRTVQLPELGQVNLALPVTVATEGLLSLPQLQAVCYAAKSFKHGSGYLLGDGTGCGKGRVIAALLIHVSTRPFSGAPQDIQAEKERRQTQGRARRCLWVSTSRDLMMDAERDLSDLGAEELGVKLCEFGSDSVGGNIFFMTYAKLRNAETARSIADWLGSTGEGLIVFDEAHSAKNFASEGSSSAQGRMVDYLQTACPKAPVLYASATACTEVSQMAYMSRLGLWGPGQLFKDFSSFQSAVEGRGLDGMEAVALELKARGVAACRTLSHAETSFIVYEAPMDCARMDAYDQACAFWKRLQSDAQEGLAEILQIDPSRSTALPNADAGQADDALHDWMGDDMKEDLEEPFTRSAQSPGMQFTRFWSAFWACQLRFFRQLVVSLKVPEVKRRADAVLADGGQPVIALWGTGEAQLTCAGVFVDGSQQNGLETMLDQFLLKHFPCPPSSLSRTLLVSTRQLEDALGSSIEGVERDGDDLSHDAINALKDLARSAWALPSVSPLELAKLRCLNDGSDKWAIDFCRASQAEARRAALRAEVQGLQLPQHPLDEILDVLGGPSMVAEMSGRSHRLIREGDGKWSAQPRHADQGPANALNLREQNAFQSGRKRVAIITEAASTGISLHSDRRRLGIGFLPPQRTLILAELGFSADKTMQQLGRVHRSNQYVQPRFELILSQVPGEARLALALARKLKSLGAVTRGDQHGGGLSQAVSGIGMNSTRTVAALHRMSEQFSRKYGADKELAVAFGCLDMGLVSGRSLHNESEVNKVVTRFLGRSMMLPIGLQKRLLRHVQLNTEELLTSATNQTRQNGDIAIAAISSDEHIAMGPHLPSLRMLRLHVGDRAVSLITGPILSLLALCPELNETWKLTRFCSMEEGTQLCGVAVTEVQLAGIISMAKSLEVAAAPPLHAVQDVANALMKPDSAGSERKDCQEHAATEFSLKRRKLRNALDEN